MPLKKIKKQDGSYVWYADFYDADGHRVRFSTRTANRKAAEKIYKRRLEESVFERVGISSPHSESESKKTSLTLQEFKKSYHEFLLANRREANTVELYGHALDSLIACFPEARLDQISPKHCEQWKSYALKRLSPTSVNIYQRSLQSMFSTAAKLEYLVCNPWQDVELVKPSYDEEAVKVFQPEQMQRLFRVIGEKEQWMQWMIRIYAYTGMRRGEGIHSEREDYVLDAGKPYLHIRNKPHLNWKTKTKKNRVVPIISGLWGVIKEMQQDGAFPGSGLIFRARREPHGVINPHWLERKFKFYVDKAGLDEDLTLHSLRHTYATTMLKQGASLYAVSKLLGHSSVKTTEKYYAHAIPTDFSDVAELVNFEPDEPEGEKP